MKLAKGVTVYSGKNKFTEEIPDKLAEKIGLKTKAKSTPVNKKADINK